MTVKDDLPIMSFEDGNTLREWLAVNHRESTGLWVRIFNSRARVPSVTFEEVLEQGLCSGWSESKRMRGDETFYLQRFHTSPPSRDHLGSQQNTRATTLGRKQDDGVGARGVRDSSGWWPEAAGTMSR